MGFAIKTPCLGRESPFVLHDDIIVTFPPPLGQAAGCCGVLQKSPHFY